MLDKLEQFRDVIEISDIAKILKCGRNSAKRIIPVEMSMFNVNNKTYVNKTKFYKFLSYMMNIPFNDIKSGKIPEVISMDDISKKYGFTLDEINQFKHKGSINVYNFFGLIRYNKNDIDKLYDKNDLRVG